MFTWIIIFLFTPFIVLIIGALAILAIITSTVTSSFVFIRLAFLTIEVISGLAVESTNWILTASVDYLQEFVAQHQKSCCSKDSKTIRPTLKKRRLPPSSLYLSSLPYKSTLKTTYSVSVPGTPDPESFKYRMEV